MAVDSEDEDDHHHSANSLYKTENTSIQEETRLLEEPVEDGYDLCKPNDHLNSTYIIFFLLGTGSLLPLNFIITAKHYWMYKLQNCSEQQSPADQRASDIRVSVANSHGSISIFLSVNETYGSDVVCVCVICNSHESSVRCNVDPDVN